MPHLEFDLDLPFPAADLGLSLGVREEPVELREFAILVTPRDLDGTAIPKGALNWGFSAPLGGCYQYVPATPARQPAHIGLPLRAERPIGGLHVSVVAWKPQVPGTQPQFVFDRLVVSFSAHSTGGTPSPARFSTVRRSIHG